MLILWPGTTASHPKPTTKISSPCLEFIVTYGCNSWTERQTDRHTDTSFYYTEWEEDRKCALNLHIRVTMPAKTGPRCS